MSKPLENTLPSEPDIVDRKRWRAERKALMSSFSVDTKRAYSHAIACQLLRLVVQSGAQVVAVYSAIRDEPDLAALWPLLRASGVVLALPRVVARGKPLEFVRWGEFDTLVTSEWGIAEPAAASEPLTLSRIEWMVMPCVGYWSTGHRLGYGGGFYDRTLAVWRNDVAISGCRKVAVGVAYAECLLPEQALKLPTDQPCDVVVTPNALVCANGAEASIFGA
jgi:5-formyltetrahydrofolate cyclo-ligase